MTGQRKSGRKPCINDSDDHRAQLALWACPLCLFFLSLLTNILLLSLLSLWELISTKPNGSGVLSLVTCLVSRIQCSHCHCLTSISGQETKPCFKPLQAKVTVIRLDLYHLEMEDKEDQFSGHVHDSQLSGWIAPLTGDLRLLFVFCWPSYA